MRQRGRKSANLVALNVEGLPPRLTPPSHLTAKERKCFVDLVNATDPRHFTESDASLLVSYCQATLMAHAAARKQDAKTFEKISRVQAMLATKLRLSPQARSDPKTIARQQQQFRGPMPWDSTGA
jgi:phage terminase small subunit